MCSGLPSLFLDTYHNVFPIKGTILILINVPSPFVRVKGGQMPPKLALGNQNILSHTVEQIRRVFGDN